jgi:hypothetical protein
MAVSLFPLSRSGCGCVSDLDDHFVEFDVHAGIGEVGEVGDRGLTGRGGERGERVLLGVPAQDGDQEVRRTRAGGGL